MRFKEKNDIFMKTHDKQVIDYGERKDYLNLFLINDMQDMCHIKSGKKNRKRSGIFFMENGA